MRVVSHLQRPLSLIAPCSRYRESEDIDDLTSLTERVRDGVHRRPGSVEIIEEQNSFTLHRRCIHDMQAFEQFRSFIEILNILQLRYVARARDAIHEWKSQSVVIFHPKGFSVLRTPECNYDFLSRPTFRTMAPAIAGKLYAGVDRMQWFDFDEQHYQNILNAEQEEVWKRIWNQRLTGVEDLRVTDSLADCRAVLALSEPQKSKSEICILAVHKVGSAVDQDLSTQINLLGLDVFVSGYGSALLEGVYTRPDLFALFTPKLNESGLLPTNWDLVRQYISAVKQISVEHSLETFPDSEALWHVISIAKPIA